MEQFHVGPVSVYRRSMRSRWSVYWRDQGQRIRKTLPISDRKEARAIASQLASSLAAGENEHLEHILYHRTDGDFTFGAVLDAFEADTGFSTGAATSKKIGGGLHKITVGFDGWKDTTWQGNHSIRKALRLAFGRRPIRSISIVHVEKFLLDVERKASPATPHDYYERAFFFSLFYSF